MFARIRRPIGRFFRKSRTLNNEPLNKVSLIVVILIDIFILFNVFVGLDDISRWPLSPTEAYPCYLEWEQYRTQADTDKDAQIVRQTLQNAVDNPTPVQESYQRQAEDRLGTVSELCLQYAGLKDEIVNPDNQQIKTTLDQKQTEIDTLNQANAQIRAQYDSTLLEQIAGQPPEQSINAVGAADARRQLDRNNQQIATLKEEIAALQTRLTTKPESTQWLALLNNDTQFAAVERGYQRASLWHPTIQLGFQAVFLLPLIFIALSIHRFAQRRGYGLVALISWHLLVIFFVPLILKIFEFFQVGALFQFVFDFLGVLLQGLVFLISYVYILLIPLLGFGIIKFFQRLILNPKVQAVSRVQNSQCIRCAKKIRHQDAYCPYCGYFQFVECPNCHSLTYKYLPHCKQCGHPQSTELR